MILPDVEEAMDRNMLDIAKTCYGIKSLEEFENVIPEFDESLVHDSGYYLGYKAAFREIKKEVMRVSRDD
jgi:hypothetical protein